MSQVTLNVPDISCGHCERTILEALQGRPGVKTVQVDIPARKVYLDYDESKLSVEKVGEILDEEGYPVAGTTEGEAPGGKRTFIPLTGR